MPERVRITSSRRSGPRPVAPSVTRELREQTGLGTVYLRGLMRTQLRLSLSVLAVGVILLGGLPLVFAVLPETTRITVAGLPLAWLLLGVAVYPMAVLVAQFYVRQCERIERQFREVTASEAE